MSDDIYELLDDIGQVSQFQHEPSHYYDDYEQHHSFAGAEFSEVRGRRDAHQSLAVPSRGRLTIPSITSRSIDNNASQIPHQAPRQDFTERGKKLPMCATIT
jgi:hypothetical protein